MCGGVDGGREGLEKQGIKALNLLDSDVAAERLGNTMQELKPHMIYLDASGCTQFGTFYRMLMLTFYALLGYIC